MAGIAIAAHAGAAHANENGTKPNKGFDWWQTSLGQYLSANPFAEVPWLENVMRKSAKNDGTVPLQFQTVEPFRLNFADAPRETTASRGLSE
jgi:hypothetical protein